MLNFFLVHGWKGLVSFVFLAIVSMFPPAMMPWSWSVNIVIPILIIIFSIIDHRKSSHKPDKDKWLEK
jgi:sterol desaturase/sphingolipid hydroxylase (fatty acid hydroxylase superfamily)